MKKINILVIFSLVIGVSAFAHDSIDKFELDKYEWMDPNLIKVYHFYPIDIPNSSLYKIVYHNRMGNVCFDIIQYDGISFYKDNNQTDTIPIRDFEKISSYEKIEGGDGIVGKYKSDNSEIDYFEIKKIKNEQFKYRLFLSDYNYGSHLIYIKNDRYISDETFGIWNNILFKKLFDADRSEWFYLSRDFYEKLDDRFSIILSDYDSVYKKITIKTKFNQYDLFPSEFDIEVNQQRKLFSGEWFYEKNSFDSMKEKIQETQIATILEKKTEWVMDSGRNTMWVKVQLADSRIGWVTGISLSAFRQGIIYKKGICNDFDVRVRTRPDLSGTVLGLLRKGDKLKVEKHSLEKTEINGEFWYWYKIKSDLIPRGEGWVYGKYLDIEE